MKTQTDSERCAFLHSELANGYGLTEEERVEMKQLERKLGPRILFGPGARFRFNPARIAEFGPPIVEQR